MGYRVSSVEHPVSVDALPLCLLQEFNANFKNLVCVDVDSQLLNTIDYVDNVKDKLNLMILD